MRRVLFSLSILLPLAACADGGEEDRPQSEVRFSATHHLYGFRALPGFGTFPVPASAVFGDRGKLNLFDDSTYTVTRTTGTSSPDRYALEGDGSLSIYVTRVGNEPTVLFRGAYGRVGANDLTSPGSSPEFLFTDRVSTPASQSLGLYYGTRVVNGTVELEGAWHLLSLHTVFNATILAPENVARGARGGVSIAAGAAGTTRTISGTGSQGTAGLTFGGSIQNVLSGGTGDGTCNLTVNYTVTSQPLDARVMQAVANDRLVLALDEDESDNEAGVLFLVKKFDAPGTPVDSVRVPGTFLVGGSTMFVNPSNSGSDAFVGTVTLGSNGSFRLDAVGNDGQDFSYQGTYTLALDGGMTIAISGTNESWFAAIDRSYNTFVFVDDFVETRANNIPELNLGFGVRRKAQ
jgi:hypothetical protein